MLTSEMMLEATRLTRAGQLTEATALLQRMFRGETARDMSAGKGGDAALAGPIIDGTAEAIDETDPSVFGANTSVPLNRSRVLRELFDHVGRRSNLKIEDLIPSGPISRPDIAPPGGTWSGPRMVGGQPSRLVHRSARTGRHAGNVALLPRTPTHGRQHLIE